MSSPRRDMPGVMSRDQGRFGKVGTSFVALRRFALFTVLWLVLAEGDLRQPWFGLLVAALATAWSFRRPPVDRPLIPGLRMGGLLLLVPYFLYQSYKGAAIVAVAALSPWRRVRPYYVEIPLRIRAADDPARMALAASMCLLPGTLSCGIQGDRLLLHVLDEGMLDLPSIRHFEALIARLFRVELRSIAGEGGHSPAAS